MKSAVFQLLLGALLIVAQSSSVYAQNPSAKQKIKAHKVVPDDGDNPPPPPPPTPLAPGQLFAGEWEWSGGGEVFHLTLNRNPTYVFPGYPNDPPRNVVIGHFVYTRNGVVIDHSLTTGPRPFAVFGSPANNRTMEMTFYSHGTKGYGYLTLSIQAGSPDVLAWSLRPRETAYRNPADRPAVPFLMPTTMTLIRQ